jgi:hypothetical protein
LKDKVLYRVKQLAVKKNSISTILRVAALVAVVAGAGGSLGFMLHTGRNNHSFLLLFLFFIWVLSPFAGLLAVDAISKGWTHLARLILYCLMIVQTIASLVSYSGALNQRGMKPAAIFLIVPLLSWLVIVIVVLISRSFKRALHKSDSV